MAPSSLAFPSVIASVGAVLSVYAIYVEYKVHQIETLGIGDEFKALCDIDAIGASCSSVFVLPEGRMLSYFGLVPHGSLLDVPNAVLGFLYYTYILLRPVLPYPLNSLGFTLFANSAAMTSSVWLAYQLTQLRELCILCWTTHVLNFSLLLFFGMKSKIPKNETTTTTKKIN